MRIFVIAVLMYVATMVSFTNLDTIRILSNVTHEHRLPEMCYRWDRPATKQMAKHTLVIKVSNRRDYLRTHATIGVHDSVEPCTDSEISWR